MECVFELLRRSAVGGVFKRKQVTVEERRNRWGGGLDRALGVMML